MLLTRNLLMQETGQEDLTCLTGQKDLLEILVPWKWQPTPVFLPENPMDGGAWGATIHGVAKSQTRLSFWFLRE